MDLDEGQLPDGREGVAQRDARMRGGRPGLMRMKAVPSFCAAWMRALSEVPSAVALEALDVGSRLAFALDEAPLIASMGAGVSFP